jgi:hypothetical protein
MNDMIIDIGITGLHLKCSTTAFWEQICSYHMHLACFNGCFQATGTPMAKILRLHLSVQCALREITIFAIEKVEKIFHCKEIGI